MLSYELIILLASIKPSAVRLTGFLADPYPNSHPLKLSAAQHLAAALFLSGEHLAFKGHGLPVTGRSKKNTRHPITARRKLAVSLATLKLGAAMATSCCLLKYSSAYVGFPALLWKITCW